MELASALGAELLVRVTETVVSNDPEEVGAHVRKELGIDLETQFSWTSDYQALAAWRKAVEQRGVLVFQVTVPLLEARAFSLAEEGSNLVVLNASDSPRGRIFSLLHEYGHLSLHSSGICDMGRIDDTTDEIREIEKFCNHLAGAVLVPPEALIKHELVTTHENRSDWPDRILGQLAGLFSVSQEVILRRLLILDKSTKDFYEKKRQEWKDRYRQRRTRKGGGKVNPPQKCISENGRRFVSLVLDTYNSGKITSSDVADYLGVRLRHLPTITQMLRQGA
ncbi:ImmA/IrrE family metallo-endopeptidase [candidate division TA06 bacterium]|uniref:ImmA/IrrE family metallo-endopeptidase n=1 Tax=candidate division TA06 bacterium TaxID=2250710 RepID=A0A523XL70_UNCT6|nr:MAG: ImmA/IrrE family metallo-endopeptidase [candidate division TA06 bacterium]